MVFIQFFLSSSVYVFVWASCYSWYYCFMMLGCIHFGTLYAARATFIKSLYSCLLWSTMTHYRCGDIHNIKIPLFGKPNDKARIFAFVKNGFRLPLLLARRDLRRGAVGLTGHRQMSLLIRCRADLPADLRLFIYLYKTNYCLKYVHQFPSSD